MIPLATLLERVGGLDEAELVRWIELRWVRAEPAHGGYLFREVDVARVRLILEIRRDFAVDEETVPVLLALLDQLYRARRQLGALSGVVAAQPADIRDRILAALREAGRG
jgi:chaperone modulatory protein CbpM